MPLNRRSQRLQHSLCRVEVGDDPLGNRDRFDRHAEWLRVQAEGFEKSSIADTQLHFSRFSDG